MSYLTHQTLLTNNLKMTPQGYHRLSGSSRWPTPVWKLNILSIVTTQTCIGVLATTTTQKITSHLQTVEDYNPQYYDPEYGKDPYWDEEIYDKTNLQFRNEDYPPTDDEDDPDIEDNILSQALIDLWQTNFEAKIQEVGATRQQEDHEAPISLLNETASLHLLVAKEGEPSYVPLSTNLGLKFKRRMLYFPMDFGELTLDGLIDTGAHSSAIPEADLRKIRL